MATNDIKKRDFIRQMIVVVELNQTSLSEAGFDPATNLTELKTKNTKVITAKAEQLEIRAALKDATVEAGSTLDAAYKQASDFANIISGLLGKKNEIVKEIRKMRK